MTAPETAPETALVRKVVVAGRDAAAWLSANALLRAFGAAGVTVEVVELPSQLRPFDLYHGLPALSGLHGLLGFDENEVLKAASGTLSLGQSFANFSRTRPPFFHPYGSTGNAINRVPFAQFWFKARQAGLKVEFEDFSINAAAAKQGRFFIPSQELSSFGRFDYGYHLRAVPYVQFLKAQALRRGATVRTTPRFEAKLAPQTGHIHSLILGDGSEVTGDLFIDATGAESLLLGKALATAFESWEQWFPDNRLLAVGGERLKAPPPFAQTRALADSVLHLAPLQDMTGIVHVYHDAQMSDEAALQAAAAVSGLRLGNATVSPLHPGLRAAGWVKNCVGIGEAACVFNPIDSPGLQCIHQGLAYLISLFPVDGDLGLDAGEYNRLTRQAFERLRNFQIGHFQLNQNLDQPYWDYVRATPVPDELAAKYALFKARGAVATFDEETFEADSWLSVFIGHGLMPGSYDPLVDQTPDEEAIGQFRNMLAYIREQVEEMSSHAAYLELYAAKDFL